MNDDRYDDILDDLLEADENGRRFGLDEIVARHHEHEATARRVFADFDKYKQLSSSIADHAAQPEDAPAPGERLGDFEIVDLLARGGMGVVYRARQRSLGGRMVALKVLRADSADARDVARFQREARELANLHHRHLAEVFGVGEDRGFLFFAMRLVEGSNLREVLERRASARTRDDEGTRRKLVERIADIADALAAVHAAGLVHRDVKPSNIVLEVAGTGLSDVDGSAVLVDFGLVRPVNTRMITLTRDSPATPSYAPPEQLLGYDVSARADVFALGVTLHDLVAARTPHQRMQASIGLEAIESLVPAIDADLAAIVGKSVDPEARWRYANAALLRDDLRAWLAGNGVSARRTPPIERARRWASKNPRRIAQGTVLALALVVISLGVAGPAATYRDVKAARAAFDRADVGTLAGFIDEIGSTVPIELIEHADLSNAARRLRSNDHSDDLVGIKDQLDLHDMGGALFVAAEAIGARDRKRDDLIERFFVACGADDLMRARLRPDDAELWATLTARIFYEQPVVDRARIDQAAPFRSAVLHVWQRSDVGADERRYLLTALAGCGQVEDLIDPVLTWTFDERRNPEELRQGMSVAERILLRSIRTGTARDLRWDVLWEVLRGGAGAVLDRPAVLAAFDLESAANALCLAALIATPPERRHETGWQAWIPPRTSELLLTESGGALGHWFGCMALGRHELLMKILRSGERPSLLDSEAARELGTVAGLLDGEEPAISAKLRVWCREANCDGGLDAFDSGRTLGQELICGLRKETDLDEDTLLGQPVPLVFEEFPRSAASGPQCVSLGAPPPTRGDPTLDMRAHENLRLLSLEARWEFHSDGASSSGAAGRVAQRGCTLAPEGKHWFARLAAFGHSELSFDFAVGCEAEATDRFVVLRLQTNGREYYPDQGRAPFELRIGNTSLATYTCNTINQVDFVVELPGRWLRLGTNTLSLRLLPLSTTPLRVWSVELKRLP